VIHAGSLIAYTYYKVISLPASGTRAEGRHMGDSALSCNATVFTR